MSFKPLPLKPIKNYVSPITKPFEVEEEAVKEFTTYLRQYLKKELSADQKYLMLEQSLPVPVQ